METVPNYIVSHGMTVKLKTIFVLAIYTYSMLGSLKGQLTICVHYVNYTTHLH